jgi:DNA-binding transcriptional regulator YiaG
MIKLVELYTFKGFGFDVLIKNVAIKSVHGEDFPDLNMNELKLSTAKALLLSKDRLTGHQFKFLRTFLKMSFDEVSEKIQIPPSTLRSWENKGAEYTGLDIDHEKAFRIMIINKILEREKSNYDMELTLTKEFSSPKKMTALDIAANLDYAFASNG